MATRSESKKLASAVVAVPEQPSEPIPKPVETVKTRSRKAAIGRKPQRGITVADLSPDSFVGQKQEPAEAAKAEVLNSVISHEANAEEQVHDLTNLVAELDLLRQRLAETEQQVSAASKTISSEDAKSIKMGRKLVALGGWRRWLVEWLLD
jgi:hypothetical protein